MQISTELIHGIRMAASMAQNLMGDANRLINKGEQLQAKDIQEALEAAVEKAEVRGMKNAVYALLDAGVPYEDIISSLKTYWNMSGKEAREFASRVQTVDHPVMKLRNYMQSQGWSSEEITRFIKKRDVRNILRQDDSHQLFRMSPEKLFEEIK